MALVVNFIILHVSVKLLRNIVCWLKAVTAALYDEGAVMVIHAVLINCRLMLERSSNIYGQFLQQSCLLECQHLAMIIIHNKLFFPNC